MTAPPLIPGTVLAGRYEIGDVLGAGGMARVYRARDLEAGGEVALKVLPPSASEELGARFAREVRNATRLDHPGCVRAVGSGRDEGGAAYLAMERLEGATLREELGRGPLAPRRAGAIARDILEALDHAHAAGVLHRDLKPENVMFRGAGSRRRAVLIDFGLSEAGGDAALTDAGSCVGSPSYLAPERILGTGYDARADVYAVGVLLYEMLAGERPLSGESPLKTALLHLEQVPSPLASRRPEVPQGLSAACERALEKRPEARFATAGEMAEALSAELGGERASSGGEPWWRRALARLGAGRPRPALAPSALSLAGSGALRLS